MGKESGWDSGRAAVAAVVGGGAAGLSVTSKVILGFAGTALGAWLGSPPSS
ncbi:IFI27L1 isoform 6 [Pan troglodytes]|uniref:IFI27L1 isoform 5 n=3 Tax=Pan TaxID=9596 RepID=A0A6D2W8J3_PANTR|nr:IFI27L1 isoform 5 [Pan troglodytes]PNI97540.1 IFI27L1 isoform 6 [Pan troglodytes]